MQKVLSIIIPSYNTEKYIDECLPTMLSEEILDDIEILLINDGSKDNTPKVAKKYVEKYPSSIRLINKENGGHGSVINRGIEEATGKYFKVIDGDDWVEMEGLAKLVHRLKSTDADMVLNPFYWYMVDDGSRKLIDVAKDKFDQEICFEEISKELKSVQLHSVTYKTSILRDNKIRFQEKCFYEDLEYDVYPVLYVSTVLFLDIPVYVYRIGLPTQSINIENVIRNKKMADTINENLMIFYNNLPKDISENRKQYFARIISGMLNRNSSIFLKMPYGKKSKNGLAYYFKHMKEVSKELYDYETSKAVSLMRKDNWLLYSLAYFTFWCKRKIRRF